jgi:hypothetical protein
MNTKQAKIIYVCSVKVVPPLKLDNINLCYDSEKETYDNLLDKLKKVKKRFAELSQYS